MEVLGLEFTVELVTFFAAALVVLGGALGVVWSLNPVHAALSLVATLFGMAVLFLNQGAELLAAVQVIVYTGAIVVLILFVMMLLGIDRDEDVDDEPLPGQRLAATLVAAGLVGVILGGIVLAGEDLVTGLPAQTASLTEAEPNINQVARVLFTDYVVAFELTGVLLTIAVVGAVVLARRPTELAPMPEPASMDAPDEREPDVEEVSH